VYLILLGITRDVQSSNFISVVLSLVTSLCEQGIDLHGLGLHAGHAYLVLVINMICL